MRTLFRIVVILLMAHAIYRFLPPYYHDERFGTELKDTAPFWRELSDAEVTQRVLDLAAKHKVPITEQHVTVSQAVRDHILIDIEYEVPVEWLPGFKKPWKFSQHHDAWAIGIKKLPKTDPLRTPAP